MLGRLLAENSRSECCRAWPRPNKWTGAPAHGAFKGRLSLLTPFLSPFATRGERGAHRACGSRCHRYCAPGDHHGGDHDPQATPGGLIGTKAMQSGARSVAKRSGLSVRRAARSSTAISASMSEKPGMSGVGSAHGGVVEPAPGDGHRPSRAPGRHHRRGGDAERPQHRSIDRARRPRRADASTHWTMPIGRGGGAPARAPVRTHGRAAQAD